MKNWIFFLLALSIFACQSASTANPDAGNNDSIDSPSSDEWVDIGVNVPVDEKSEDMESETGDDPNDFYARIPKEKDAAELAALRKAREASGEAQMTFFSTMHVKEWMAGLEEKEDEDGMPLLETLPDQQFQQLTTKEHIYYHLAYPEEWSQNCAEMYFMPGNVKAIARYLPFADDGYYLSERQTKYMENNRDSVSYWVKSFLKDRKALTTEMLNLIADLKLKSAIPDMARIYRSQATKDDLILTTLIQMMVQAEYPGWTQSKLAKEGWDKEMDVLELNQVNADMVLMYAEKYASGK